MGLNYAYELIADRQSADRLVHAVCEHLTAEDRARLLACLGGGLPYVMECVERDELERYLFDRGSKPICLSFLFDRDDRLEEYDKENSLPRTGDRIRVGCVWTEIKCGADFVLIRTTAATTAMSLLFEQSASVRRTFVEAGRSGEALMVLFDDEQGDFVAVRPYEGRFAPARECESFMDEDLNLKVDAYCAELVASARRKFAGPALPR